jgi:hypothetical protein
MRLALAAAGESMPPAMRARLVFGLITAALLAPARSAEADPSPATVQLKDGRVLHDARALESGQGWVTLRSAEGLFKVEASDLPAGFALPPSAPHPAAAVPAGMAFERFDPNQEPAAAAPAPAPKPAAARKAAAAAPEDASRRGCEIVSFEPKAVHGVEGCASVVIRNATDEGVQLRPGEISCTVEGGGRHAGHAFFSDTFPVSVRRREVVPAHGELTVIVTFANEPLAISAIEWSR